MIGVLPQKNGDGIFCLEKPEKYMTLLDVSITDLAALFDPEGLTKAATLQSGTIIYGYFDLMPSDEFGVENAEIQFTAKYSDVLTLVQNNTMVIGGVTYKIKTTPKNDEGISVLTLSKD